MCVCVRERERGGERERESVFDNIHGVLKCNLNEINNALSLMMHLNNWTAIYELTCKLKK